jgi:hypothetical protein
VVPRLSPACTVPEVTLVDSQWDVLAPTDHSLRANEFSSELNYSICTPVLPPPSNTTLYLELGVEFLGNLLTPVSLSTVFGGDTGPGVQDVTGPPGTTATVYAAVPVNVSAFGTPVAVTMSFQGPIEIGQVALIAEYPIPPG